MIVVDKRRPAIRETDMSIGLDWMRTMMKFGLDSDIWLQKFRIRTRFGQTYGKLRHVLKLPRAFGTIRRTRL